jgi:hypothetical protein
VRFPSDADLAPSGWRPQIFGTRDSKIQSTHDYSAKQRDRSYAGLEAWVPCSWLTFASATAKFCIAYEASFAVSALYQTSAVKKVANTARLEAFNFDLQGLELRFFVMGNVQFKTTIAPEWCRDSSRLWDSRRGRECKAREDFAKWVKFRVLRELVALPESNPGSKIENLHTGFNNLQQCLRMLCAQIVPRLINPCLYQGCRVLRRLPVRTLYRCTERSKQSIAKRSIMTTNVVGGVQSAEGLQSKILPSESHDKQLNCPRWHPTSRISQPAPTREVPHGVF